MLMSKQMGLHNLINRVALLCILYVYSFEYIILVSVSMSFLLPDFCVLQFQLPSSNTELKGYTVTR